MYYSVLITSRKLHAGNIAAGTPEKVKGCCVVRGIKRSKTAMILHGKEWVNSMGSLPPAPSSQEQRFRRLLRPYHARTAHPDANKKSVDGSGFCTNRAVEIGSAALLKLWAKPSERERNDCCRGCLNKRGYACCSARCVDGARRGCGCSGG